MDVFHFVQGLEKEYQSNSVQVPIGPENRIEYHVYLLHFGGASDTLPAQ